jgi:hypothetical protein
VPTIYLSYGFSDLVEWVTWRKELQSLLLLLQHQLWLCLIVSECVLTNVFYWLIHLVVYSELHGIVCGWPWKWRTVLYM